MLRASLATLVALCLSITCSPASWAETTNWGKDRTPGAMIQKSRLKAPAPSGGKSSGGKGTGGTRRVGPAPGPPAEIMIVTQPPGCIVKLETGKQIGSPEDKPDVSRYKFNVQAGKRKVTVSKPGGAWQTREVLITVQAGKNNPVLITLVPENYENLFKELITVYGERYAANKNDGNALLHLLYLNRLTKNYREVDRLLAELKANKTIDVREEAVKIQRFADEVMPREQPKTDEFGNPLPDGSGGGSMAAPTGGGAGDVGSASDDPLNGPGEKSGPLAEVLGGKQSSGVIPGAVAAGTGIPPSFFQNGKLTAEAKSDTEKVLRLNSFFYPGFAGYLLSAHQDEPEAALNYLKGALQAEMGAPLLWYDTGVALSKLGKYQDAYNAIDKAYHLDTDHAWVLAEHSYLNNLVGRMTDNTKMVKDAEYFGMEAIEKDPRYLGGYLNLVTYYELEGRHQDAAAKIAEAIALDPTNVDLYGVYGDVLAAQGQWDEAEAKYERALELRPGYAYGLYGLGKVAEGKRNPSAAKKYYLDASAADREFAEPLIAVAWLEEQQKEYDAAVGHYLQVTKINPGYFDPWYHIGTIYYNAKQLDQAAPYLYEAFKLNPQEPWTNYYLGKISHQKGDKQKALDFYTTFLELHNGGDQWTQEARAFVSFATNIEGMTPSKYQTDTAQAGDEQGFLEQFFGADEDQSGGEGGGDLADNFKPEWMKDDEPERGNLKGTN